MSVFRGSLGILLATLAVVVLLGSACGPRQATPPVLPSPKPTGNQPPVISSLVAQKTQIYPSGNTEIRCIAQDADGDQLDFGWACTGGNFSGAGPTVVWKPPPNYGTYTITVTVEDRKGGSAQRSVDITVVPNQPPRIDSLTANPPGLLYGGNTILTCIATDPDGDAIKYSWEASEGSISGVGKQATWVAPNKGGNFNITVIVSDSKGGETRANVMVPVSAAVRTVTIRPVAEETGTVDSRGDKDNSRTRAGDDEENIGYCAYWSYDVWNLAGKKIQSASLKFNVWKMAGDPFPSATGLGGLRLWKVTYGDKLPKFQYTGTTLVTVPLQTIPPTVLDVTQEVAYVAAAAVTRFQVEATFMRVSNGNSVAEFIEWSEVVLEVTYSDM